MSKKSTDKSLSANNDKLDRKKEGGNSSSCFRHAYCRKLLALFVILAVLILIFFAVLETQDDEIDDYDWHKALSEELKKEKEGSDDEFSSQEILKDDIDVDASSDSHKDKTDVVASSDVEKIVKTDISSSPATPDTEIEEKKEAEKKNISEAPSAGSSGSDSSSGGGCDCKKLNSVIATAVVQLKSYDDVILVMLDMLRYRRALQLLSEINVAVLEGRPFQKDLKELLDIELVGDKERSILAPIILDSDVPVARVYELIKEFNAILAESNSLTSSAVATTVGGDEPSSSGLIDRLLYNLGSLVTVRKVGKHHDGDDDGSIIARAESYVNDGDIESAVRELRRLTPSSAALFKDWLQKAQRRIDIEKILVDFRRAFKSPMENEKAGE